MVASGSYNDVVGTTHAATIPWLPVLLCVAINMLDGFDVLAISFTAADIAQEWGVSPVSLGLLFSAGLLGMTLGALFLSPIADILGRRAILLICLGIISAAMLLSATANSVMELAFYRVLTGLGIGGLLAGVNTSTAEYTPPHRRDFAISLVTAGYPVGAVLGGIVSIDLIENFGWRSVFIFGGCASLVMIPVIWALLPESLAFLVEKRPPNALARINKALKQLKRPPIDELPPPPPGQAKTSLRDVFGPELRGGTIAICSAFFFMMLTLYFAMSWIPKNMVDMGLTVSAGISISVLVNLAGIVGGITLGILANFIGLRVISGISMVLTFIAMVIFGSLPADFLLLTCAALFFGFAIFGAFVSLYAIVAEVFPAYVRTTGTGLALGIGRIGATIGPALGGYFIATGWDRWEYYTILGLPCLVGAVFATIAARRVSRAK